MNAATLHNWTKTAERTEGSRAAAPARAGESEEVKTLRRENAELRRANEILKIASAFFAQAELDRRLK
ncbi:transposase-like protein [Janibacter cremeus]|uniref:Transposase-like protein n=1 Tax=Janibacter cremeus TaxID=1285192 RepID=A0A852VSZ8_9MICO|nr:transposase-like protein [Janibacter cremeus]